MIFTPTRLADAFLIDVEPHGDERGFLARTFCEQEFAEHGAPMRIVQSSTIHSPTPAHAPRPALPGGAAREIKLVRCTRGSDLPRDGRPAPGLADPQRVARRRAQRARAGVSRYVPKGFAQGYQTLEDDTEVLYQMSHQYVPEAARGVRWDDPAFGIDWPPADRRIISERDQTWPGRST